MQYRVRTLLAVVTGVAVLAAIASLALRSRRPVPILDSAAGRQTVELMSSAKTVRVEVDWPPDHFDVELSPEARCSIKEWLGKAVRDKNPAKYVMSGTVKFDSNKEYWWLFEISSVEMGFRDSSGVYWRGLDGQRFQSIINSEATSSPEPAK